MPGQVEREHGRRYDEGECSGSVMFDRMEHNHRPFAPSKTGDRPGSETPQLNHRKTSLLPAQRISPDTPIVYRLSARSPENTAQDPDSDVKGLPGALSGHPQLPGPCTADCRESSPWRRMRLAQGLLEIIDQILHILDANRKPQQVRRHRCSGAFHTRAVLDQALGAAQ